MSTDFYNYLTNVLQKQKSTVFWHTVYIKLLQRYNMYCNRIYNPYKTHCYFPRLILEALNVFKDSLNYTILTFLWNWTYLLLVSAWLYNCLTCILWFYKFFLTFILCLAAFGSFCFQWIDWLNIAKDVMFLHLFVRWYCLSAGNKQTQLQTNVVYTGDRNNTSPADNRAR